MSNRRTQEEIIKPDGTVIPAAEAARRLGIQAHTLAVWRCRGIGPRYTRYGDPKKGRVVYHVADVAAFMAERSFTCTSAETLKAAGAERAA